MKDSIYVLTMLGEKIRTELIPNIDSISRQVARENPWFTKDNLLLSLESWSDALRPDSVTTWLSSHKPSSATKRVGVIAAGNIPMVGLHDLLCVLTSGHHVLYKKSQSDQTLIDHIYQLLVAIDPETVQRVEFVDRLKDMDAVIATGSNNTSRYFEHYFSGIPHIIRKNRSSVAIIAGNETVQELEELSKDIFSHFGLGCRNVSKVYIPEGYDLLVLLTVLERVQSVRENNKYMNNYDYNRALMLMNLHPFFDTGNLLITASDRLHSSVSVLHYEFYKDVEILKSQLLSQKETIQCVVTNTPIGLNEVRFGQSQYPKLWDYADDVDVLQFLNCI